MSTKTTACSEQVQRSFGAAYQPDLIGGMISSTLLTLIVIPAIYAVVKQIPLRG